MSLCLFCKQEAPQYHNYCSWNCHVEEAKSLGGKVITPNNLPIACIKHDGTMMEHEHGDHPDYKFPIYIELYAGKEFEEEEGFRGEVHALIYTDGSVALTMYEYCYAIWSVRTGELLGGSLWKKGEWRLSVEAMEKLKEFTSLDVPEHRSFLC